MGRHGPSSSPRGPLASGRRDWGPGGPRAKANASFSLGSFALLRPELFRVGFASLAEGAEFWGVLKADCGGSSSVTAAQNGDVDPAQAAGLATCPSVPSLLCPSPCQDAGHVGCLCGAFPLGFFTGAPKGIRGRRRWPCCLRLSVPGWGPSTEGPVCTGPSGCPTVLRFVP